jgi:hypothetical protein
MARHRKKANPAFRNAIEDTKSDPKRPFVPGRHADALVSVCPSDNWLAPCVPVMMAERAGGSQRLEGDQGAPERLGGLKKSLYCSDFVMYCACLKLGD